MATTTVARESRPTGRLRRDTVFDLLSAERRIEVIEAVDTHGVVTLSELAREVAAIENDVPIDELTESERKRVYVALYQCHLPKLDDHGAIDWEKTDDEHEIAPGPHLDDLTAVLDPNPEPEGRWLSRTLRRIGL